MSNNSVIYDFLSGKCPDHKDRYITDYIEFNDFNFEYDHDWIQWAFPTNTKSEYNPHAPIIDGMFIHTDLSSQNSVKVLYKYLGYIGFNSKYEVDDDRFWDIVAFPNNHNVRRISRVLIHLVLTNRQNMARWVLNGLQRVIFNNPYGLMSDTVAYWYAIVYNFNSIDEFKNVLFRS